MKMFFDTSNVPFAIFTGDILSHDNDDQLSRAYIEYEEKVNTIETISFRTLTLNTGDLRGLQGHGE